MLCSLPDILMVEVLCQWVQIEDVRSVDTAFCNKKQRTSVLQLFQADEFVLDSSKRDMVIILQINWIGSRNIKLNTFFLDTVMFNFLMRINFDTTSMKAVVLHLTKTKNHILDINHLLKFVNSCRSVTSLEIHSDMLFGDATLHQLDPHVLQHLTTFKYTAESSYFTPRSITFLADHCASLTDVTINFRRSAYVGDSEVTALLLALTSRLTTISLQGFELTNSFMGALMTHSVPYALHLRDFSLVVDFPSFAQLLDPALCPQLRVLTFDRNDEERSLIYSCEPTAVPCAESEHRDSGLHPLPAFKRNINMSFESLQYATAFLASEHTGDLHSLHVKCLSGDLTAELVELMAGNSPGLREIALQHCDGMSTTGLSKLLTTCRNLHTLTIVRRPPPFKDEIDELIDSIQAQNDLHYGTASAADSTPLVGYEEVFSACAGNKLTTLTLRHDPHITTDTLTSILAHSPHIHTLCIEGCVHVELSEVDLWCAQHGRNIAH